MPTYNSIKVRGRNVPYLRFEDENSIPLPVYNTYEANYIDTLGSGRLLDWKYYPLTDYQHIVAKSLREEVVANIGVNYQIVKSLSLDLKYQYQKQNINSERKADMESFFTRNLINQFTQLGSSASSTIYPIPKGNIIDYSNSQGYSNSLRAHLNFNKSWSNQKHTISSLMGTEIREAVSFLGTNYTIYGQKDNPTSNGVVDFVNKYPNIITGTFQAIPGSPRLGYTTYDRFVSFFGNASYAFKQRYSVYSSIRRDASNIFGLKTNDKWNPFWSVGAGWELSREKFYVSKWLPYLKMKASWGTSGNVDQSRTSLAVLFYNTNLLTTFPYASVNQVNNPELRWEKNRQINNGIEFSLKNQVVSGSIEYYRKKGVDLYGPTPYNYTGWGTSGTIVKNVANMSGNGVDVFLQSKNINSTFRWVTNLIFNYNSSKTTDYFEQNSNKISSYLGSGNTITPVIGKPLYAIAAYKWGWS